MPDLTYPERLYVEAELRFARRLADLGGWCFDTQHSLAADDRQVANKWLAAGLLRRSSKDRRDVLELTDAGRAWLAGQG